MLTVCGHNIVYVTYMFTAFGHNTLGISIYSDYKQLTFMTVLWKWTTLWTILPQCIDKFTQNGDNFVAILHLSHNLVNIAINILWPKLHCWWCKTVPIFYEAVWYLPKWVWDMLFDAVQFLWPNVFWKIQRCIHFLELRCTMRKYVI